MLLVTRMLAAARGACCYCAAAGAGSSGEAERYGVRERQDRRGPLRAAGPAFCQAGAEHG